MLNPLFTVVDPRLAPCRPIIDPHPLLYLDLTEAVRRGIGKLLYIASDAVLVGFSHPSHPGRITEFTTLCGSAAAAKHIARMLPWDDDILVAVHESFFATYLREHFPIKSFLGDAFHQVAYLEAESLPSPPSSFTVKPLTLAHLPQVAETYHDEEDVYVRDRLQAGVMLGAFDGDALAGFIGVHAEGAAGLLEVLPQYRRRGVASLLQTCLINRQLEQGHIPYGQVLTDNRPSLALQCSLGMSISQETLCWLASR